MAEPVYPPLVMPDGVGRHQVTVWSNGTALDADVYRPASVDSGAALPAVVLCHGWGGSKLTAERYAALFASAGMITLTFTQGSWFGSGSPLQLVGDAPGLDDGNEALTRVRFIRDLVDPFAWTANLRAALDYIEGEPNVDPARIGLWGTSFGGGIGVHLAASDDRVKALAVQVPAIAPLRGPVAGLARKRAIDTARGDADTIPQGVDPWPDMPRTPYLATMAHFDPLSQVERLRMPTLIIDAGDEELFPIAGNGARAAEIIKSAPGGVVDYQVIPGITHYGIYFDGYGPGSRAALDWWGRRRLRRPRGRSRAVVGRVRRAARRAGRTAARHRAGAVQHQRAPHVGCPASARPAGRRPREDRDAGRTGSPGRGRHAQRPLPQHRPRLRDTTRRRRRQARRRGRVPRHAVSALANRTSVVGALDRITAPALVIAGDEDQAFPLVHAEELAGRIPGAQLEVLPRVGHLAPREAPAAVAALLKRFLAPEGTPTS
jgi:pimeloyl-ACP methyl ester carboxylesterase